MAIRLQQKQGAVLIPVRVQPRASRTELVGEYDGAFRIRVAAPPVEGEANRALVKYLAKRLGVASAQIRIAAGAAGRDKTVEVRGLELRAVARAMGLDV